VSKCPGAASTLGGKNTQRGLITQGDALQSIRLAIALLAISTALYTTRAHAGSYGRTPGHFGVTANGASQYTIPIWAPPGPKSIQPSVALTYNSQSGIGPLGVGWTLSGLGAITRCNLTYAQDTAPAPVALVISDGYCINGNRLQCARTIHYDELRSE
jgi:hypothetical protein